MKKPPLSSAGQDGKAGPRRLRSDQGTIRSIDMAATGYSSIECCGISNICLAARQLLQER